MINPPKEKSKFISYLDTLIIIYGFPFFLFWLVYTFYNFGVMNVKEMIKTTGLVSISLLTFIFIITPLSNNFIALNRLRSAIKPWVIFCVIFVFIHFGLILQYRYQFDLIKLFDSSDYYFWGILIGIFSLIVLLIGLFKVLKKSSEVLTAPQLRFLTIMCFLALGLAFVHFYMVESNAEGVLVIKRLVGRIIFAFAGFTVFANLILYVSSFYINNK